MRYNNIINFKNLLFIYIVLLFFWQFSFAQNQEIYLSFDESKVPFSKIKNFVFRGDDFFYEKAYNNIKYYSSNYSLAIFLDLFVNSSETNPLKFEQEYLDLNPNASSANINIAGLSAGRLFSQFYGGYRSYHYFSYSKDDGTSNSENDISFDGSIQSGILSTAIGLSVDSLFTPIICLNILESYHENKTDELSKVPEKYREIYLNRFHEVYNKLNQSGFEEKEKYSISFIGYSRKYGLGAIIAPNYTKIDIDFVYGINCSHPIFKFSQLALNPFKIIEKTTNITFSKNNLYFEYFVESNFSNSLFKNYNNVISDFKVKWDWKKNYAGMNAKVKFDHSRNIFSFFSVALRYYGFKIGYEYINNKVFMPTLDRIYNNTITFSLGGGFSKGGKLVVP